MPIMDKSKSDAANNYAFIDSQNVNLAIKDLGWSLDFSRFRIYLKDRYHVTQAYLFLGWLAENQKLYTFLEKAGYKLIFKPTFRGVDGKVKGNCDAELVLHTMIEYPNYDKAVAVTGDGDFFCLVEYLRKQDKLERLLIPNERKYSSLLNKVAPGKMIFLNRSKKKLERIEA